MDVMTADDAAKQISELEARRYQAMTAADLPVLEELFSADLVYTHSDASADSKQSYLDKLASGHFDYGVMDHPESSIVVRGDCALVFGDMRGEVLIAGATRVLNSKCLAVWVRENGNWALLAFQPTKYPA
jgi:ketosteroid isomerase-like protein